MIGISRLRGRSLRFAAGMALLILLFAAAFFGVASLWPRPERPEADFRPPPAAHPIEEVGLIVSLPYSGWLVGRRAELTNVHVREVDGDRTFWIGPADQRRVFVALGKPPYEEEPPGSGLDIDEGDRISLRGIIRWMPSERTARSLFGSSVAATANEAAVYIAAESARVLPLAGADESSVRIEQG